MLRLIYTSHAPDMSDDVLADILRAARANNGPKAITGLLLYGGDSFVQVLEGPEAAVDDLLTRIKADPRHSDVEVLIEEMDVQRYFGDWNMGYIAISDLGPADLGGRLDVSGTLDLLNALRDPESYVGDFLLASLKQMLSKSVKNAVAGQV